MKENKNNNKKEDSMLLAQCSIFLKKDGEMRNYVKMQSKINKKLSKETCELIKEKFDEVGEILSKEFGEKNVDDLKELKEILEEALKKMLK